MKIQHISFILIILISRFSYSTLPCVGGVDGVYNVLDFIPANMNVNAVKNAIANNDYGDAPGKISSVDAVIQNAFESIFNEYTIDLGTQQYYPNKDNWKELQLPHGTYRITKPIEFHKAANPLNIRVVGKGAVIDNRCTSSANFSPTDYSASAFVFGVGTPGWNNQSTIVRGVSFTSDNAATSQQNRHGIYVFHGKIIVEDCEFFNLSSGVFGTVVQYSKIVCNNYCNMNRYGIEIHRDPNASSVNDNNLIEFNNQLDYQGGLGGMWLDISESTIRNNQFRGMVNATSLYIQGFSNVIKGNTLENGLDAQVILMKIKCNAMNRLDFSNVITENLFQNSAVEQNGSPKYCPNLNCLVLEGCGWAHGRLASHTIMYNTFLGSAGDNNQVRYISKDGQVDIHDNYYSNPACAQTGWDTTHFKSNVKIEGSFETGLTSVYGNSAQNGLSVIAEPGISSQSLYLNEVSSSGPSVWFNSCMAMVPTTGGDINKKDITFSFGNYANSKNQANTEMLRIRSDGNVGIGDNSPSEKLQVSGIIRANGYKSSDGSTGITENVPYKKADGTNGTFVIKNGLIISY